MKTTAIAKMLLPIIMIGNGACTYSSRDDHQRTLSCTYKKPTKESDIEFSTILEEVKEKQKRYIAMKEEAERLRLEREAKLEAERIAAEQAEIQRRLSVGYNYYNFMEVSGIEHSELQNILSDTGLADVAWTIVQCEKDFGVNAFILTAILAEESGWGQSDRAVYQNNLSGYAVYDDYAEGAYFETRFDSVVATARLLAYDYGTVNGKYHTGFSLDNVNSLYSANPEWSTNVNTIAYSLLMKYKNNL